jgi:hypothetical protein
MARARSYRFARKVFLGTNLYHFLCEISFEKVKDSVQQRISKAKERSCLRGKDWAAS